MSDVEAVVVGVVTVVFLVVVALMVWWSIR